MVAMKFVVVLVALAASAYGKPWGLDINPVSAISGAVKGAADAANNGMLAAATAAGVDKQLDAVANVANSVTKPLSDAAASNKVSVNIPGMDALPKVPGLDSLSHPLSKIPGLDSLPSMDSLPKIPGMDSLPSMDSLTKIPGMDSLPKIPGMDSLPSMDSLPKIPGMDSLPKIPGLDSIPGLNSLPKIPGLDKLPSVSSWNPMNKLSSLNPMNALSGLASWNPISSLRSMMSPWNMLMRMLALRYPGLANALETVKDNIDWLVGKASELFRAAINTGKISVKQALDVIYAAAASAAKHSSNPIKYVIVGLNQAIKNGDIDSTTAVKILVRAINAGVHNKTFTDATEPLAYATQLALEDGIITAEEAEKLREIAKNANADETKEEANKEEKKEDNADANKNDEATPDVTVNVNTDADKKDDATAGAGVNVNVNVNTDN